MTASIVWFRNDLRLDDHEPLHRALDTGGPATCVVCLDPRDFDTTPLGFPKTGPFRAQFRLEAIADLRRNLRARRGDLLVRSGRPEDVLPVLASETGARAVFAHAEICDEETRVERAVRRTLFDGGVDLDLASGNSMLHPDDLPFDHVPDVFTHFRRAVERDASIRAPWPAPDVVAGPDLDPGEIPTLAGLRLRLPARDPRTAVPLRGGETEARARLDHYLWESDHVARYHHTRNGLIGVDYSTKFSPYLAQGSISARRIHDEVRRYEAERTANRSTYWVIFELLWRDFFRLTAEQHGNALFRREGLRGERRAWRHDRELLERWIDGRTGDSFVDANMRELAATGYMSNRGRQNAASHLAHDLGVDWTWGAEWFESVLIDYDVHSNWGNWAYVAGVGNDPRVGRRFDTARQAAKYDPDGGYVRLWTVRARP